MLNFKKFNPDNFKTDMSGNIVKTNVIFVDYDGKFVVTALDVGLSQKEYVKLMSLSEQIGKNSNKIQRLRTLIQQEKKK